MIDKLTLNLSMLVMGALNCSSQVGCTLRVKVRLSQPYPKVKSFLAASKHVEVKKTVST